jgi:hypothetical protein
MLGAPSMRMDRVRSCRLLLRREVHGWSPTPLRGGWCLASCVSTVMYRILITPTAREASAEHDTCMPCLCELPERTTSLCSVTLDRALRLVHARRIRQRAVAAQARMRMDHCGAAMRESWPPSRGHSLGRIVFLPSPVTCSTTRACYIRKRGIAARTQARTGGMGASLRLLDCSQHEQRHAALHACERGASNLRACAA